MKNYDNIATAIQWADEYIKEYDKNCYSPFKAYTGEMDKKQRLFIECCNFLQEIENATDVFRKTRDKITFT